MKSHSALMRILEKAKNGGCLWADQGLGELSVLTNMPYYFDRKTEVNNVTYEIKVKK